MKILVCTLYYKPIRPGYGTRTPEIIIDSAAALGHEVIVYTCTVPHDMITELKYGLKNHKEKVGTGSVEIKRIKVPTSGHHKSYRRSFIYLWFMINCFFKMLFVRKFDAMMGLIFPPFNLPIQLLAKVRKKKFYMHQGDLFPDTVFDFNLTKNPVVINLLKKTSMWSFSLADIIGVNNYATKIGMEKYPIKKEKIVFLELAIDTDVFKPIVMETKSEKFTVLYNGVFGPAYDFDLILDCAKKLENYDIQFIIAGKGELKNQIEKGMKKRNLKNTIIKEPVQKIEDLILRLNSCDVTILPLIKAEVSKTSHPSKIFEYMACGKPVICAGTGALKELFDKSKAGILVEPGNVKDFANAILKFYDNRILCKEIGQNSREYAENNHSMEVYKKKLSEVIKKLH